MQLVGLSSNHENGSNSSYCATLHQDHQPNLQICFPYLSIAFMSICTFGFGSIFQLLSSETCMDICHPHTGAKTLAHSTPLYLRKLLFSIEKRHKCLICGGKKTTKPKQTKNKPTNNKKTIHSNFSQ